ncbi:MAG: InlB B-repeat-containing protein, partial [Bacteroidales bacterium]|nr:InlB B-repeat-containing protein [Bacteroidales bacterium]
MGGGGGGGGGGNGNADSNGVAGGTNAAIIGNGASGGRGATNGGSGGDGGTGSATISGYPSRPSSDNVAGKAKIIYSYSVTFNSNGGSLPNPYYILDVPAGTTISAPTNPTRGSYRFDNWWRSTADASSRWYFGTGGSLVMMTTTLNAKWRFIPYLYNPNISLNTWDKCVTLSWTCENPDGMSGNFWVYRREGLSGSYTRLNSSGIPLLNNSYYTVSYPNDTDIAFDKTYEYAIIYRESGTPSNPLPPPLPEDTDGPPAIRVRSRSITTTPNIGTWTATAEGVSHNIIRVSFNVDSRLREKDPTARYRIERSINGGEYSIIFNNQEFGSGTTITRDDIIVNYDPCLRYKYRVVIDAFGIPHQRVTNETGVISTLHLVTPLKASKGEYTNIIRLQWNLNANPPGLQTYRVSRRMANTNAPYIEQEIVTSNARTVYWNDNNALTGVGYQYEVALLQICDDIKELGTAVEDVGFIQAFGTVSGRVTYGTGNAVPGVNILARRNEGGTENQYYSLYSPGGDQKVEWRADSVYFNNIWTSKKWTLQFWVNPQDDNTGTVTIGNIGGQEISMIAVDGGYQIFTQMSTAETSRSEVIPANHFSHIAITRDDDNIRIYTVLDQYAVENESPDSIKIEYTSFEYLAEDTLFESDCRISFGHALKGYIDDVRFWNRPLSEVEVGRDYGRYLVGNENGLRMYWTFDEGINGYAFDMSRIGTERNGNHAKYNTLDFNANNVPNEIYQLALKGITDINGNYMIRGIPYAGEGTSYSIVPSLAGHNFNPQERLCYISKQVPEHNGADFTDISSFPISGRVVFDGGNYPVAGCSFEINDVPVKLPNGTLYTTNYDGSFTFSVPIGVHKVRVVKEGHTFTNNGYLPGADEQGFYNYNNPRSNLALYDQTRVKLVGRVVGGLAEHNKPLGFGESNNNIGMKTITLESTQPIYNFINIPTTGETFAHNQGQWKKPDGLSDDYTTIDYNPKNITIHVSPETGEFMAMVYPVVYNISELTFPDKNGFPVHIIENGLNIDLSSSANMPQTSVRTWADSTFISGVPGVVDHWEYFENSDTVSYHAAWKYYYQATPTFSVSQVVGGEAVPWFGERLYQVFNAATDDFEQITLYDFEAETEIEEEKYLFGKPVFRQGESYMFLLSAFEGYYNLERDMSYTSPVSGGVVSFAGELLLDAYPAQIQLNSSGQAIFIFPIGTTDHTTGERELSAILRIGNYSYYSETFGQTGLRAYVLGGRTTGTDFLTSAGDEIDFILHDPPGSNSYAYIEAGTSITITEKTSINTRTKLIEEDPIIVNDKWIYGADCKFTLDCMIQGAGIGAAWGPFGMGVGAVAGGLISFLTGDQVIKTKETKIEKRYIDNSTLQRRITFTDRYETSKSPEFVGHNADVFFGNAVNVLYGLTNDIAIAKTTEFEPDEILEQYGDYSIGKKTGIGIGESLSTFFAYTGYQIENIMIPKWENALKILLKYGVNPDPATIEHPVYVSKWDVGHDNFGKLNSDPVFGADATNDYKHGPSYDIILPYLMEQKMAAGWDPASTPQGTIVFTDSVLYYHNQIKQWKDHLAENERRKVDAIKNNVYVTSGSNISFGSGVKIERSETLETTMSNEHVISTDINIYNFTETIKKLLWFIQINKEKELTDTESIYATYAEQQEDINTFLAGFVLETGGTTDQISVDVCTDYESFPHTFMFRTRGGRTSCPYEGDVITKYFEPGQHIINEGTMQIEVPKIAVNGGSYQVQVPSTKPASFMLDITNESETNGEGWFKLTVDEATNPYGAVLKIDGLPIGNGRYFLVPSGIVLKKTLTVEKGPNEDIYKNIRLILTSDCDPVLRDSIMITVEFIPTCSEIEFKRPENNWVLNTFSGDSILIELENYDINFANFSYVQLEYRYQSWKPAMNFYIDETLYNAAPPPKILVDKSEPTIKYWWHKGQDEKDGNYEFRARTVCESTGAEYITPIVSGIIDMVPPRPLGAPSPANGILGVGDELSITFNEDIQSNVLETFNNFSITGILNAQEIASPTTGLAFSGAQSAQTE